MLFTSLIVNLFLDKKTLKRNFFFLIYHLVDVATRVKYFDRLKKHEKSIKF